MPFPFDRHQDMAVGASVHRTPSRLKSASGSGLRHWEVVGLLRPSGRTEGGSRLYAVLGIAGVAKWMRFIPRSVMVGFVNALAILVFLVQAPYMATGSRTAGTVQRTSRPHGRRPTRTRTTGEHRDLSPPRTARASALPMPGVSSQPGIGRAQHVHRPKTALPVLHPEVLLRRYL